MNGFSQSSGKKSDNLLKDLAEKACKCIDSVDTRNKSAEEIAKDVHICIDKQTGAYQMGAKLLDIDLASALTSGNKTINIEVNTNKNSKDYKDYYYKLEKNLMDNCKSLKKTMAASNIENENSVSLNSKSKNEYSKGLKYFNKDEYQKALPYFLKAVKIDSTFAFAWDNIGICYRKLNNYDAAINAYNKSLSIDPNGIMPLQNIAVAYEYKKEYTKALTAYETYMTALAHQR